MRGFLSNLYLRPSCHFCPSKSLKSDSDITVADFWGIQNIAPEFDDDKGVSLVLINTTEGNFFLNLLDIYPMESTYEDALKGNSSIVYSVKIPNMRNIFWSQFDLKVIDVVRKITNNNKPVFFIRLIKYILRKIKI